MNDREADVAVTYKENFQMDSEQLFNDELYISERHAVVAA